MRSPSGSSRPLPIRSRSTVWRFQARSALASCSRPVTAARPTICSSTPTSRSIGQEIRSEPHLLLRGERRPGSARPPRFAAGSRARHRGGPAVSGLSAVPGHPQRPRHRLRGTVALAASDARSDSSERLHSDRGRERADPPARRMGDPPCLRDAGALAARHQDRGQFLRGPVPECRHPANDRRRACRGERRAEQARGRDHRVDADLEIWIGARDPERAAASSA